MIYKKTCYPQVTIWFLLLVSFVASCFCNHGIVSRSNISWHDVAIQNLHVGYVTQFLQYVYNSGTSHKQHYLCTGNWSAWIVLDSREELLWFVLTPSCCCSRWTPPDGRIPGTLPLIHFTCLASVYSLIEYVVSSTKYQTVLVSIDCVHVLRFIKR